MTTISDPFADRPSAGDAGAGLAPGDPARPADASSAPGDVSPGDALVLLHARVASRAPIADPLRRAARAAVAELRAGRQRPMLHWTPQVDSNSPRRRLRQKRAAARALRLTP